VLVDTHQGPDFRQLARQLYVVALRVFAENGLGGRDSTVPGVGMSPEDFVWKVIDEYVEGKHKYHSSKGQLVTYLGTALRRDVIDALRKASHEHEEARQVFPDGDVENAGQPKPLDHFQDENAFDQDRVFAGLDDGHYIVRVLDVVGDEPELREVCEAIFYLEIYAPREIADALNIDVAEYHNRKRKLRRRLLEHQLVRVKR
jgi:DNA-directed RNA polymerase specialized sigma24 family protein